MGILSYSEIVSDEKALSRCKDFYECVNSLHRFGCYCNRAVFVRLFGSNGDNLWRLFVVDCVRDIFRFYNENYLSNEQMLILSNAVINNERELRMIAALET